VLYSLESLFFRAGDQRTIAQQAGACICMTCVDSKNECHRLQSRD